jgi:Uma2 family endonuclease
MLEGWLVAKVSKNPSHVLASTLIRRALERLLPPGWYVALQDPITLSDSEPEPDLFVVRGEPHDYRDRHPGPQDVALVVEVADTTLRADRGTKKRTYAHAGIPIYWIVNLVDLQFEVYTDPSGSGEQPDYAQGREYGPEDTLPVLLAGAEIGRLTVRELLP